jgi:hypothetical protein
LIEKSIAGLLLVVGVIHFLPIAGLFGVERLTSLYAIEITDGNLEILLRHRAALFGILGAFIIYAAFRPHLQPIAFVAASLSIAAFFFLTWSVGEINNAIRNVVIVDVVAAVALLGSVTLYRVKGSG